MGFAGMLVTALTPVAGGARPSLTLVAMVKLLLKLVAGKNVKPASNVLRSVIAPEAVHTPVPGVKVEVTVPEVPVLKLPAAVFDKVKVSDGDGLALKLLEGARVGVVGGNDFGSKDHFRISYATSMENIERGMDNLENYLKGL